ncbi:MAG: hypothetical protein HKN47_26320 [Pirellulaceae bacterium]|nr:hypothetical protein [Pirellulaceae bacterium]
MRYFLLITLLITLPQICFAEAPGSDLADAVGGTATEVLAPDPGPPPARVPQLHPAYLVAGILFSTAAVLFALAAHVRGKLSRKGVVVGASFVMVLTWGGLLVAMSMAPQSDDYKRWEAAHRKWKNQEMVIPMDRPEPEPPPGFVVPDSTESES